MYRTSTYGQKGQIWTLNRTEKDIKTSQKSIFDSMSIVDALATKLKATDIIIVTATMLRCPSTRIQLHAVRHISKQAASTESRGGGAGIGNVHTQLFPSDDTNLFRHVAHPRTVSVIGAPMTYGQPFVGTDRGPELLRESGLLKDLSSLGWRVEDIPDLDFGTICAEAAKNSNAAGMSPNAKHSLQVGAGCCALADLVESKLRQGHFPLILGGDVSCIM